MASIKLQNVSVSFPIYHAESRSLKRTVIAAASGRVGEDRRHRLVVEALRHISVSLKTGDRLGFVGANGAGKTTLLRTMAGIYEPVEGQIETHGAVTALLDPGQGMNHELTGRENIRLRGLFNALNQAQIDQLQDDVASFSELAQFLELPVRTYSSGMIVRLGFALATAIKPQILLMDEWILAGDAGFLQKARNRLETMVRGAEILVLSSHSADIIMKWCNRVIWIDGGQIKADGSPDEVLGAYLPADQFARAQMAALPTSA
ncbi:MAG: ABC transporter ATP-binding protein [Acidocella sp. 20-61-6]|nr:MAG: ABC transporter ATP-binding protein [Acidocella sp. 20-61-6]